MKGPRPTNDQGMRSRLDRIRRDRSPSGYMKEREPGTPATLTSPLDPAPYDDSDISAFKALRHGNASAAQQQRALAWVIECGARLGTNPFSVGMDGERLTAYACGARSVGESIVRMLNTAPRTVNSEQGR